MAVLLGFGGLGGAVGRAAAAVAVCAGLAAAAGRAAEAAAAVAWSAAGYPAESVGLCVAAVPSKSNKPAVSGFPEQKHEERKPAPLAIRRESHHRNGSNFSSVFF